MDAVVFWQRPSHSAPAIPAPWMTSGRSSLAFWGVFLVMGVGTFCRLRDWLTTESDRSLANLATNVLLPAYFIHNILGSTEFDALAHAWVPPVFGFMTTALGFFIGIVLARFRGQTVDLIPMPSNVHSRCA